jgi:23S rRNA (guanine745-N1)-methyltransferase
LKGSRPVGEPFPGTAPLACSVRACGAPLARSGQGLVCPRGHAFDRAKSGYVNLLQPQDRRSLAAGDERTGLEARARLWAAGAGEALRAELARRVGELGLERGAVALELGSGTGEMLAALSEEHALAAVGIDLSSSAAELAARRFPACTWVVANADRRLPILDRSVALVLVIHGRRNPAECARVLRPGGFLVAALPAADDLSELRALVQGRSVPRERTAGFLAEHEPFFALRTRSAARTRRRFARPGLLDLLAGTYRGERRSAASAIESLDELEVTLASDILVLGRSGA